MVAETSDIQPRRPKGVSKPQHGFHHIYSPEKQHHLSKSKSDHWKSPAKPKSRATRTVLPDPVIMIGLALCPFSALNPSKLKMSAVPSTHDISNIGIGMRGDSAVSTDGLVGWLVGWLMASPGVS